MFQSGNALLLVITLLLAVAGTIVAVLMVREVIEIGRSVYTSIRDEWRFSHASSLTSEKQVTPFRDRKTVERVIDYLEEEPKQ